MAPGYSIRIVRGMPATSRANNERNQPPVWRLASPRLPPLPGGRARPLLEFPAAKRVKSGASKIANTGNLLKPGEPGRTGGAVVLGHHQGDLWEVSPHPVWVSSDER